MIQPGLERFRTGHGLHRTGNPAAAQRIAQRIHDATQTLREFPFVGRIGDDPDQREWRVQHTPYLLVYEIHGDTVHIARVWHVRQGR